MKINSFTQPLTSFQNKEINILNDLDYVNCQRCKVKKSVFSCIVCESFKFLCTKCDNYVHSLPSKQAHSRIAILDKTAPKENTFKEEEEKDPKNNDLNTISLTNNENNLNFNYNSVNDLNYKFNLSPINKEKNSYTNNQNFRRDIYNENPNHNHNNNNDNDNYSVENNNTSISINKINNNQNIQKTENSETNHNNKTNTLPSSSIEINNFSNFRIPNAQNFSREYVYEIKTIFDKEKSELIYKINSLNMTIERLKINFTDQINYLSNQLEDVNKKSNFTIKQNQENFENRIRQSNEDKELLYEDFNKKLSNLEGINKDLTEKLQESLKTIYELKTSNSSKVNELENLLRKKEEEIKIEKLNCDNKLNELRKYLEDDKIRLMESYDKNINLLIQEFDVTKEKLNNLLKDREDDLRNLIEKHKLEIERLQSMNKEMIHEIECHKSNIYNIRIRSEENKDELEVLRDDNDSMKRELRFQISELKMIDGHNKSLLKENVIFSI